jgi:acetolactate synthase-1/2/3 large subunit
LEKLVSEADTLIVVGAEITDIESNGYTKYDIPNPAQKLIHISNNHYDLGKVFQPDLSIVSDYQELTQALASLAKIEQTPWSDWVNEGRKIYLAFTTDPGHQQKADPAGIMMWLRENTTDDTMVSFGAGNYTQWVQRYFGFTKFGNQMATQSAVMGYSVPAAISASLLYPDRTVLSFAGDGCFLMNGQEIATAARYNANVKFIVINNSLYGSIQMHQENKFPNRSIAVELTNPDFDRLALAYGIPARKVTTLNEFIEAYTEFDKANGPSLIEIVTSQDIVTPSIKLEDLRGA